MKVEIQVTDTNGHEPAFTWLKNYFLEVEDGTTTYTMARKVKRHIGWTGKTTLLVENDQYVEIRPYGEEEVCIIKIFK
jgi:hypothetical protein